MTAGRRGQEVIAHHYTTRDRRHWGSLGGRPRRVRLADVGEKGQTNKGHIKWPLFIMEN